MIIFIGVDRVFGQTFVDLVRGTDIGPHMDLVRYMEIWSAKNPYVVQNKISWNWKSAPDRAKKRLISVFHKKNKSGFLKISKKELHQKFSTEKGAPP